MDENAERIIRLESLTTERDRRYEERFVAQEKALKLALENVEKSHRHLLALVTLLILLAAAVLPNLVVHFK